MTTARTKPSRLAGMPGIPSGALDVIDITGEWAGTIIPRSDGRWLIIHSGEVLPSREEAAESTVTGHRSRVEQQREYEAAHFPASRQARDRGRR